MLGCCDSHISKSSSDSKSNNNSKSKSNFVVLHCIVIVLVMLIYFARYREDPRSHEPRGSNIILVTIVDMLMLQSLSTLVAAGIR